jgi:hypothetical protein
MSGTASTKHEPEPELGPELGPGAISGRMRQAVEDQVAALTEDLVACLASARTADPKEPRSERADAVKIAGATAVLLQSLTRATRGIRFEHRIVREQAPNAPRVRVGWNGDPSELLADKEYEALDDYEKTDYANWTNGLPPAYGVWRKDSYKKPATVDQLEALRQDVRSIARRIPLPPENRGSNTDDGNANPRG